jgi:L-cystine uptake protein TcyP (sodium:dicarboxylate symporter family)
MDVQNLQVLVGALGFPIVVAGFLLIKIVPALDGVKEAVNNNTNMLKILFDKEGKKDGN